MKGILWVLAVASHKVTWQPQPQHLGFSQVTPGHNLALATPGLA
jgi:hypothetical protein